MWFFKWWQLWFLFFVPLNVGMILTKKPHEAASPASTSAVNTSTDNELSEPIVLDYKNSIDTILKDLVSNWQSPITYLKSRGYLTKELEQAAQNRLRSTNVVTPLPVEKPKLHIQTKKKIKKKQHKYRRFATAKIVTEMPQQMIQQEEEFLSQIEKEPARDLESNLDTENEEDYKEEKDSELENIKGEELKPANKINALVPRLPSSNNPILNNLERSGKAIKNPSPGILIWDGKNGSKIVPINKPTIVHWNRNRQLHPSKPRMYNSDGDYSRKNTKIIPGYMPELVIWDGAGIDGSNRKNNPRRTKDWNDELNYMPSMFRWDSQHNRLLLKKPTNAYIDGLVKNFSNRKRIDNDYWKK